MLWKFSRFHWSEAAKYILSSALIAAVLFVVSQRHNTDVLASRIGVTTYSNGLAVVEIPYRRDGTAATVNISIDGQPVIRSLPAQAVKYSNDNYFFRPPAALNGDVDVSVSYGSGTAIETLSTTVKVTRAPEEIASASKTTDTSAPDAAAEAVVTLAKLHNADDKLPAYVATIVDELKGDLHWSVADSISVENFASGLNVWAKKKDLAFLTEKIMGKFPAVLDSISQTLIQGGTAQLQLQFKRSNRIVGSRMVNVVRVVRTGNDTFVGIRDTAGPTGIDVYRVHDGVLVDYAFSDDRAVIGWGFIQIWDD